MIAFAPRARARAAWVSMTFAPARALAASLVLAFTACNSGASVSGATTEAVDHATSAVEAAEAAAPPGVVTLNEAQKQRADIAIGKVVRRQESGLVRANAELEPDPDRVAKVGTRVAGRISSLKAGIGARVTAGQALAAIESSDLGRAKADFLAARVAAQIARETADREKGLFEARVSSRRDWEQAEAIANQARAESGAAELRLHTLGVGDAALARLRPEDHYAAFVTLTAPIAGVVVARAATLGQMVTPSDTLFEIMDLSQIWVVVDVYERDIHQVHVGQAVTVTVAAMANKPRVGTIADVGAVLDPATRAVHVRVVLANPDGQLRPGMFATVEIASTKAEPREGLYVPTTAVVRGQRDTWSVFVPRGPLTFERRKVELGGASGEWTEVTRGLTDADAIVTRGAFALKSELEKSADEDE